MTMCVVLINIPAKSHTDVRWIEVKLEFCHKAKTVVFPYCYILGINSLTNVMT